MLGFQNFVSFLGRICFSIIFILAGINKIMHWDASEQYFVNQMLDVFSKSYNQGWSQPLFDRIMPMAPTLLVLGTIAELGGGLLILLGIQVRLGAVILCLFLIPSTLLFHNFWAVEGNEQQIQMIMFLKNLCIFGGSLLLLAFGKGQKPPKKMEV